jgi:hypothetical protein
VLQVGSQGMSSLGNEKAPRVACGRRHRHVELRRGLLGAQLADRRVAVPDSPRRVARDGRLGSLPRLGPEAGVRPGAVLPLAQLPRLRHGRHRRPLRAPVLEPALHHGLARAHLGDVDGRPAILDRRPRRGRRHAGHVRLPAVDSAPRVQPLAARQLRRRHDGQHGPAAGGQRGSDGRRVGTRRPAPQQELGPVARAAT